MELRQHTRIPVQYHVWFSAQGSSGQGLVLDLSLHGCRLRAFDTIHGRSYLQLRLMPSHSETPILVDLAAVRWSLGQDYGVHFLSVRPDQYERLSRLIDLLHIRNALSDEDRS